MTMISFNNNSAYIKSQELMRQNKNKTKSQQNQIHKTLEGVVVNNFIKDENKNVSVNMDDICNTLIISDNFDKEKNSYSKYSIKDDKKASLLRSALPLAAVALITTGGGCALTGLFKRAARSLNDNNILRKERLPNLGMNMNIRQEHEFSTYMALRNPNKKTILAMIGVFLTSGLTLIGKNFVDGIQEIWIRKKEADANKALQEGLIDIETKAFSGKLDVIREELSSRANYFNSVLNSTNEKQNNPFLNFFGFKGNFKGDKEDEKSQKTDIKNSPVTLAVITGATLLAGIFLGRKMFKNFQQADSEVRKYVQNETGEIEKRINILVAKLKGAKDKDSVSTDFENLKNLLQIKRADSIESERVLKQLDFLSEKDVAQNIGDIMTGIKSIYGDAPETLGGKVGQIQYYCYLDEASGHAYNWIMNPDNPFAGQLFFALATVNAAGYSIKKAIEGMKEAAVIQEGKKTERDLQERLIDTEIRNFKAKKESAIEPLMNEFKQRANNGATKEELKTMADNILLEIKNGPPFVYA